MFDYHVGDWKILFLLGHKISHEKIIDKQINN